MADKKKTVRSCADCTYYSYDEEYGGYVCDVNMDEDEYVRLIGQPLCLSLLPQRG